jgi:hypothetical protein
MGYKHEFLDSPFGLARIIKNGEDAHRSDPQDAS